MTNEVMLLTALLNGTPITEFQPQNNKQAYLAYLCGAGNPLPTPRTTEEVLLYKLCMNKTGTVLLPETELTFEYGSCIVEGAYPFVEGKTYVVKWNGEEVRCVAYKSPYAAAGYVSIGNKRALGEETGEPFGASSNGVDSLQFISYDGSTKAVVSITEM